MKNSLRRVNRIFLISLFCFSSLPLLCASAGTERCDIECVIQLKKIREDIIPHIKAGDTVIEASKKAELGKITDITQKEHALELFNEEDGCLVEAVYEGYFDVYITVLCPASVNDGGFSVDGYALKIGKEIFLRLPDFCGSGRCIRIDKTRGGAE